MSNVEFTSPAKAYGVESVERTKLSEGDELHAIAVTFVNSEAYGPESIAHITAQEGEFYTTAKSIVGLLKRYVQDGHIGNGKGMILKVVAKKANTGRKMLTLSME